MTTQIDMMRSIEFTNAVQALLQVKGGRLSRFVQTGNHTGESAKVLEQVGSVQLAYNTNFTADTPIGYTEQSSRWVDPTPFITPASLISNESLLMTLADPTNTLVAQHAMANLRGEDDIILAALLGSAKVGQVGATTTETFDTTNMTVSIDVGGTASGLNIEKLLKLREKALKNNVDLDSEMIRLILTPEAERQILSETQATSFDYTDYGAVKTGRLPGLYGVEFIVMNIGDASAYPISSSSFGSASTRYLPAFVASGVHFGSWNGVEGHVDTLPGKRHATQIYTKRTMGATRLEQGRVWRVAVDETK